MNQIHDYFVWYTAKFSDQSKLIQNTRVRSVKTFHMKSVPTKDTALTTSFLWTWGIWWIPLFSSIEFYDVMIFNFHWKLFKEERPTDHYIEAHMKTMIIYKRVKKLKWTVSNIKLLYPLHKIMMMIAVQPSSSITDIISIHFF